MRGYPKHLNSVADYEYVRANFPREQWAPDYQKLLDGQKAWIDVGKVEAADLGVTSKTLKVVAVEAMGDAKAEVEYRQCEYKDDPNCQLVRLGLTTKEIKKYLSNI